MSLLPGTFYLNSVLDEFFDDKSTNNMKCDIYEKDGLFNIELDIPGFSKNEINVACCEGYLIVTAEKEEKKDNLDKNYIRKERVYGRIQRKFYVGDIDSERIEAKFKEGILKVTVPKDEKKSEKKKIEIK